MSKRMSTAALLAVLCGLALVAPAAAQGIGQVKLANGTVTLERQGTTQPVRPGMQLLAADVVTTGADGSIGITMRDDSLLSLGPNSTLALDAFAFEPTTNAGRFDASLRKGSLAVVSGRLAKQSPEAMSVRTPFAVLGVRGTEFVVSTDAAPAR